MPFLKKEYPLNFLLFIFTVFCAFLVLLLVFGIFLVLFKESFFAIFRYGFLNFIFSSAWDPVKEIFGGAVPLTGTLITAFMALIITVAVALGIAVFLIEIASKKVGEIIGLAIELLAAKPSIIYGMWGLFTLAPLQAKYMEPLLQKIVGSLPPYKKTLFRNTSWNRSLYSKYNFKIPGKYLITRRFKV